MLDSIYRMTLRLHRGSYMSAHVLLNLLNELWKRDKTQGLLSILPLFATSLINLIIQEHEYWIRFYLSYGIKILLKSHFCRKNVIILSLYMLYTQRYYGRHNVSHKSINH